jgi:hypothetical protein
LQAELLKAGALHDQPGQHALLAGRVALPGRTRSQAFKRGVSKHRISADVGLGYSATGKIVDRFDEGGMALLAPRRRGRRTGDKRACEQSPAEVNAWLAPDNLASAVIRAHRYEPILNLTCRDMATHCGAPILLLAPMRN